MCIQECSARKLIGSSGMWPGLVQRRTSLQGDPLGLFGWRIVSMNIFWSLHLAWSHSPEKNLPALCLEGMRLAALRHPGSLGRVRVSLLNQGVDFPFISCHVQHWVPLSQWPGVLRPYYPSLPPPETTLPAFWRVKQNCCWLCRGGEEMRKVVLTTSQTEFWSFLLFSGPSLPLLSKEPILEPRCSSFWGTNLIASCLAHHWLRFRLSQGWWISYQEVICLLACKIVAFPILFVFVGYALEKPCNCHFSGVARGKEGI